MGRGNTMAKSGFVTITVEMAKQWLEKNDHNRKVTIARVNRYAEDIKNNMWLANGESIIISESGKLLDGQHRLLAVVEAGLEIEALVVTGIPDVQDGVDTFGTINSENRSNADVLTIEGIKDNPADVVKYIRTVEAFNQKALKQKPSGIPYKNHEIIEMAKSANIEEIQEVITRSRVLHGRCNAISKPAWILLAALEHKIPRFNKFLEELAECNIDKDGSPVSALLRRFENDPGLFRSVKMVWISVFKAFHFYENGTEIKNLKTNLGMEIEYPTGYREYNAD